MTIEVTSLDELTGENVRDRRVLLTQLMQEFNPKIDTIGGALKYVLFHNEAIYAEKNAEESSRLQRSQSLLEAATDPDLADDDIIDAIASNYLVSRGEGSAATGELVIVVSALQSLTIAAGAIFESNGTQYSPAEAYTAVVSANDVSGANERALNPRLDGNYEFSIPVTALTNGISTQVTKDTTFTPQVPPINFVKAFAAADFTGAADDETNEELIDRLLLGAAAKTVASRSSMDSLLRANFPTVTASSIIGTQDVEMLRNKHSIFPGATGSRVDWYVRTQAFPQRLGLTKTATLIEKTTDGHGIWQMSFNRDEAPGFYDVFQVAPEDGDALGSFTVTLDQRSNDLSELDSGGLLPDIEEAIEGVYSRFQTAVVQFEDPETDTSSMTVGDTKTYDVTLRLMPDIDDVQELVSDRRTDSPAVDTLVKAPVPCFLEVYFTIQLEPGQEVPDTGEIATEVAARANSFGFTGRLPASALADVIHNSLDGVAHIDQVDIYGQIRRPDGTWRRIRSSSVLVVPDEPEYMTTARTVGFYLDPTDVVISTTEAAIPQI